MRLKSKLQKILQKLKDLQPIDASVVSALYTLSQKSLLTALIFNTLITIFLYPELSYSILLWAAILDTWILFRLYCAYLFATDPQRYPLKIWHKKFMLYAFITGTIVSSLGFLFIPSLDAYHQLFVLASLLGLTGGATASLSSDFRIGIGYISIIMFPLIVSLFMINSTTSTLLAMLMILFYLSQVGMIFNNYTEQKKVKELIEQQNILNNIFSESPFGMLTYDSNLNFLYTNAHAKKIFGQKNNTAKGVAVSSILNADTVNIFHHALLHGSHKNSVSFVDPNGTPFWLHITGFSFKSSYNTVLGGVAIIEDKTQEYKDKKELELLHVELQNQIKENESLLSENKQFIANIVHQIRTPLSVILANASLIEMKVKNKVDSYLIQINSSINMLSNSYEDLSYIIANEALTYKPVEIDLSDFLNNRITFFSAIAQANNKTISANIPSDIEIFMNDTELERIVDNNLSNAIKYSSNKSDIKIILEKSNADIVLKFITEGKKIHDTSKIFDKNYTESFIAKRSLGLGLNMVKAICEKNHISYSARSEKNTNTFTYIFKV